MMLHANKANTPQSVAVSAWFVSEGYASSGGTAPESHGEIELALELAKDAETLALVADKMAEHDLDFPVVYDYEVSSPFGGWLAEEIRSSGEIPTEAARKAKIVDLAVQFFQQGSASPFSIRKAVGRILEGLDPFPEQEYSAGMVFKVEGCYFMLANADLGTCVLVSLQTGNRWSTPVEVSNSLRISLGEFEKVIGRFHKPEDFELVSEGFSTDLLNLLFDPSQTPV